MTTQVITRWYRPPELLWGARHYSAAVDMWSIGTILVELVLRVPFLAGDSDIDQLKKTFHAMGSPSEQDWPGHTLLPDYHAIPGYPKNNWWTLVASIGKDGQDLVREMLRYDPRTRPSAKAALHHRFFTTLPRPTPPAVLPKPMAELKPRAVAPEPVDPGKRKIISPGAEGELTGRSIARKLFV